MADLIGKVFAALFLAVVAICAVAATGLAVLVFIVQNIVPIGIGVVVICILWLIIAYRSSDTAGHDVYIRASFPSGTPKLSERQARQRIKEYRDLEAKIRANTNR